MTPSAPYVEFNGNRYVMMGISSREMDVNLSLSAFVGIPIQYDINDYSRVWPEPAEGVTVINPRAQPKQSLIDAIASAKERFPEVFGG